MASEEAKIFGYSSRKLLLFCGFLCVVSLALAVGIYGGGFQGYRGISSTAISKINHWNYSLDDAKRFAYNNILKRYETRSYSTRNLSFDKLKSAQTKPFDIEGNDVLVFLHIQKTAGTTFEKFLVKHLQDAPCQCEEDKKRCKCFRPNAENSNWLFSRYSTGWPCGLHADWTELVVSNCVDNTLDRRETRKPKRRYFYTTFLRDPLARYVSEFRHVSRGATWAQARHVCNGRSPTPEELPWCFDPEKGSWEGVTLNEFLDCPYNLAHNRQTRMLADLTLVGCYNSSSMPKKKRDTIILESAKSNLKKMAFFGLQEEMEKSQILFEEVFGMKFRKNMDDWHKDKSSDTTVTRDQKREILERNSLDVELYRFAKTLFQQRFKSIFDLKAPEKFQTDFSEVQ